MLPSDMNLKIRSGTVGYNNKILVSDEKFSLGKNKNVNALVLEEPVISMPKVTSHKAVAHAHWVAQRPWALWSHELSQKLNISHNEEKISLALFLAGGCAIWNIFR